MAICVVEIVGSTATFQVGAFCQGGEEPAGGGGMDTVLSSCGGCDVRVTVYGTTAARCFTLAAYFSPPLASTRQPWTSTESEFAALSHLPFSTHLYVSCSRQCQQALRMSGPQFTFGTGTPATSGGSNTPTFGSAGASPFGQNASGGNLFGNIGGTPTTTSSPGGLFGNTTTPAAGQTGSLFGGQGAKPTFGAGSGASTPNLFTKPGEQSGGASTPTLFGAASQTPKPAEPTASSQLPSGGMFGAAAKNPASAGSLFGSTTPAPSGAGLFGNTSTTPAGPPPQSSGAGAQSLFGNQAAQQPAFTGLGQKPASSPFGAIGATTATPSATSATTASTAAPSLFGAAAPSQPPSGGTLFGTPAKAPGAETSKPDAKPNLFGAAATSATPQTSGSLFNLGGPSGAQTAQKPLSFPSKPTSPATTTETPQKPLFSLGGTPATTAAPAASTTTPAPAGGMFSGLGAPKTTAAAESTTPATTSAQPAASLFNINKPTTTAATTTAPQATTATTTGTTATPITTATTTAGTTTAPTTTATTGGVNLGASTAGPAPPAQSRLKNKTMDEIITRWATDLTKYQKEFQEQAEQVAKWDRMLVENGTKVQKLYGNTVDAERATQEVERQLASVEGQQDELSSWLDRYEQEVDTLLSKQVGLADTLQGPDQERERTYKLAERLSERLNEMGQDLTSMIEEVNSASATLSKTTKADEPISQIVRILNSHLSQLQQIDQGTATLRAKIAASQRVGGAIGVSGHQHMGSGSFSSSGRNGNGSGGGGVADDFYRAYMGRR
ncbi:FG-nucleoporin nsp1 [Onygenales sp. PD_12]|nr:FG-nucleoporin nsp1 [Onygenales sp. PD_12]